MTPEQHGILDRCARMLKLGLRGFKSVVFHLPPDDGPCTVDYEIAGKIKVDGDNSDQPFRTTTLLDDKEP